MKANPQMAHSGRVMATMKPTKEMKPMGDKRFMPMNFGKPIDNEFAYCGGCAKTREGEPGRLNDGKADVCLSAQDGNMLEKYWLSELARSGDSVSRGTGVGVGVGAGSI